YTDVYGQPVARVTYQNHSYEIQARKFYVPYLRAVLQAPPVAAATTFLVPYRHNPGFIGPPSSRHVMGTLRMGADPTTSVTDGGGKFHDLDNLWACDGSVFPTSS